MHLWGQQFALCVYKDTNKVRRKQMIKTLVNIYDCKQNVRKNALKVLWLGKSDYSHSLICASKK